MRIVGRWRATAAAALAVAVLLAMMGAGRAAMVDRPVRWTVDGARFDSVLVWDDASAARRPGLVMVPNWHGIDAAAILKARRIAAGGYVVLLADVYGAGVRPVGDAASRAAAVPLLADTGRLRARMRAALEAIRRAAAVAPVDPARLAAIGFCFGGAAVLELARDGADLAAVVSFHGELSSADPAAPARIRARVLAINGADDPLTAPEFPAFLDAMRRDPAPWRFVAIGHAVHCFTERDATATTGPCRFDPDASAQAFGMMRDWLRASFSPATTTATAPAETGPEAAP